MDMSSSLFRPIGAYTVSESQLGRTITHSLTAKALYTVCVTIPRDRLDRASSSCVASSI